MGISFGHQKDYLPQQINYDEAKDKLAELNSFCKQSHKTLGFELHLKSSQLQFKQYQWRNSIVPGTVTIRNSLHIKTINVIMNLKSVFNCHIAMKQFEKPNQQSNETPEAPTPGAAEQCCICLDKMASMMLPCYVIQPLIKHTFCPACTQTHIINRLQKKCPICRAQFHENNNQLQKKIITVVSDEESLVKDYRQMVLGYLRELNSRQVKQIQQQFASNEQNILNKAEMAQMD